MYVCCYHSLQEVRRTYAATLVPAKNLHADTQASWRKPERKKAHAWHASMHTLDQTSLKQPDPPTRSIESTRTTRHASTKATPETTRNLPGNNSETIQKPPGPNTATILTPSRTQPNTKPHQPRQIPIWKPPANHPGSTEGLIRAEIRANMKDVQHARVRTGVMRARMRAMTHSGG